MKIHCIGIGGIGLSALARYYLSEGYTVTGSDTANSDLVEALRSEGIRVSIGQKKEDFPEGVDRVIYTIAIRDDNEEFMVAKERGVQCLSYPEALGEVTKQKTTIAICGTHGKTTTTAMMYYAMKACGISPTVIIGSLLHDGKTNFIKGTSEYLIVEACEYKRSFLNLFPTYVVVTNIDEDHLDYYKDLNDIRSAFASFAEKIPVHGVLAAHADITLSTIGRVLHDSEEQIKSVTLSVVGEHNRSNASLVLTLLASLRFDEVMIRKGLYEFPGTWRRLEYKGKTLHGVPVYDDYGHHPKEIEASLEALAEKYPRHEYHTVLFFQPHLYSRTAFFFDDFVKVLLKADEVFILPIYKAREEDDTVTSSRTLVDAIRAQGGDAREVTLDEMPSLIEGFLSTKTVIVNMGAGNAFEELDHVTFV